MSDNMERDRLASVCRPTPLDVSAFLPYASAQLQATYSVRVCEQVEEEYVSKAEDKSKHAKAKNVAAVPTSLARAAASRASGAESGSAAPARATYAAVDELVVAAVHGDGGALTELSFSRELPRLLVQIVALCAPFHPLLARLAVRRCRIDAAALHEIGKLVPLSHLTDVCLDDSPTPGGDYRALLDHARLERLSLSRCQLGDEACVALAGALGHPMPASRSLRTLTLTSKGIANAGALALAAALRSNRTLAHLDLAGNQVSDEGACAVLRALAEFPLTYDELMDKRRRCVGYLRTRREHYERILAALRTAPLPSEESRGRRRAATLASAARPRKGSVSSAPGAALPLLDSVEQRAGVMAAELVGVFSEPFDATETVWRDGWVHSLGNARLSSLNVAHNHLSYRSVAVLLGVLQTQAAAGRGGLLRVELSGNKLPAQCAEYGAARALLDDAVALRLARAPRDHKDNKKYTKSKVKM